MRVHSTLHSIPPAAYMPTAGRYRCWVVLIQLGVEIEAWHKGLEPLTNACHIDRRIMYAFAL